MAYNWKSFVRIFGWAFDEDERECEYKYCDVMVAPYEGVRSAGVFCSDTHAAADQEEAAL